MVAVPTKLVAGRKTRFVPTMLTVPLVGVAERMVSASPFGSESLTNTGIVTPVSSGVVTESLFATGGRLTKPTATLTSAVEVRLPSLMT